MPLVWGAVHGRTQPATMHPTSWHRSVDSGPPARDRGVARRRLQPHCGGRSHQTDAVAARPRRSERLPASRRWHVQRRQRNAATSRTLQTPTSERLVLTALERFADLGIDGFRFDLASLLTRDGGGLIDRITEWGAERGVRLIAEPWDLGAYQVGQWQEPWLQWNDRFRDQIRGFVRGEPGLVPCGHRCVCRAAPICSRSGSNLSVNFITAHDGLTMHDLTIVDQRSPPLVGQRARALRMQQLKNYFTMLLLSAGTPMFVMGDEFGTHAGRSRQPVQHRQRGDVGRLESPRAVGGTARLRAGPAAPAVVSIRRRISASTAPSRRPTPRSESRSIAWSAGGLYVMANAWWEPVKFEFQEPGPWKIALSTSASTDIGADHGCATIDGGLASRLERQRPTRSPTEAEGPFRRGTAMGSQCTIASPRTLDPQYPERVREVHLPPSSSASSRGEATKRWNARNEPPSTFGEKRIGTLAESMPGTG